MKYFMSGILLLSSCLFHGQNLKISAGYGFSIGEKQNYKRIMAAKTLQAGHEFELTWNTSLVPLVEFKQFQFSYDDMNGANIFSKNSFISVPVVLRKYFNASKRSRLFTDLGLQGSYYFNIKNEIRNGTASSLIKAKHNDIGFNIGIALAAGLKMTINDRQSFDIGMYAVKDFWAQKKSMEWMKNNTINFTISYYQVLKRTK